MTVQKTSQKDHPLLSLYTKLTVMLIASEHELLKQNGIPSTTSAAQSTTQQSQPSLHPTHQYTRSSRTPEMNPCSPPASTQRVPLRAGRDLEYQHASSGIVGLCRCKGRIARRDRSGARSSRGGQRRFDVLVAKLARYLGFEHRAYSRSWTKQDSHVEANERDSIPRGASLASSSAFQYLLI
jgi:hypothetical protein